MVNPWKPQRVVSYLFINVGLGKALSISAHGNSLKTTEEVALQILLLCQFGVGTVANVFLFVHNFSPVLTGSKQRPRQVILSHMAVANALTLFLTIFPNNMSAFAPKTPPTELKCKLEFFSHMVARSTNLCSTCVLSIHQFVILVPINRGKVILRAVSQIWWVILVTVVGSYVSWITFVFQLSSLNTDNRQ